MRWPLAAGRWPLAARRSLLSTERCPFLSLSSRRRRFCSQGRYCSEAARGHWTMLAQTDDVDRLENAERWNMIASFGHAIRWSYRRSPPVSRKPDGDRDRSVATGPHRRTRRCCVTRERLSGGFDPATPLPLGRVSASCPSRGAQVVALQHHCVESARSEFA